MISREMLKEILLLQQRRVKEVQGFDFVTREKLEDFKDFAGLKHCIIITGARRCGKSVFLSQIIGRFFDAYYYVNFEDERLALFGLSDFSMLYEVCRELFGEAKTFFLDEVQNIAGWERWVRRMYDDGFKFFITGSNANLLSKELATLLTGRHLQISLYPFSFREFLKFKRLSVRKEDIYFPEKRALIQKYFSEYLITGGFPEYVLSNKVEILQEYFNDIVQRDVVERYNVKSVKQLKVLARYLLTNAGNLTTYNQLRKVTEIKSTTTAIKYFSYLEYAYLLFKISYFDYSLKRQMANPFKVFAIDNGLRNSVSFRFSSDTGKLFENLAAIEFKRENEEVYYWKNSQHEEVDFVVRSDKILQLIQVCYNISDTNVKKRELKALLQASKELRCNNLLIITADYESEEKIKGKRVRFVPMWKWILTKQTAYLTA